MIIHLKNTAANICALFVFIFDNIEYFPNESSFKIIIFNDISNKQLTESNIKSYQSDIFSFKNLFKLFFNKQSSSSINNFTSLNKSNLNHIDVIDFIFLLKSKNIYNNDTFTNSDILSQSIYNYIVNTNIKNISIEKNSISQTYGIDCDFIFDCDSLTSIEQVSKYMHDIVNYKYINFIYFLQYFISFLVILIYILFLYGFVYYLFCIVLKS
jgi:hypothetical protein